MAGQKLNYSMTPMMTQLETQNIDFFRWKRSLMIRRQSPERKFTRWRRKWRISVLSTMSNRKSFVNLTVKSEIRTPILERCTRKWRFWIIVSKVRVNYSVWRSRNTLTKSKCCKKRSKALPQKSNWSERLEKSSLCPSKDFLRRHRIPENLRSDQEKTL